MDISYYEQKLTNALIATLLADDLARKFVNAADKRGNLISRITARIEVLCHADRSSAATYIDYSTGKFKGGSAMPHCLDSELKNLFYQLESVTSEINKYPYTTSNEALNSANAKKETFKQVVLEVKTAIGEEKYKLVAIKAKEAAIRSTGINF